MPPYLIMVVWGALHAVAAGLALWRGGWPERAAIGAAIVAWIASALLIDRMDWMRPQYAVLCVDAVFFATLAWIGIRGRRLWALAAAGFQLGAVFLHLTYVLNARGEWGSDSGYLAAEFMFSVMVFAAIFVGVVLAATRREGAAVSA